MDELRDARRSARSNASCSASGDGAGGTPGRLDLAAGGTLFLEDIERVPAAVQVRLLRVLHDRAFERVGGGETRRADIRLIAATTVDLEGEVRAGRFRDDLWVRLSLVRVRMPALARARRRHSVPGREFHSRVQPRALARA